MADTKLMYGERDIKLIKQTFAENDYLLQTLRKLFFGQELSESDKDLILKTFKSQELRDVLQHKVYGLNNLDTPIGQISDFWLNTESQIFGASKDTIKQAIESKKQVLEMFKKSFELLTNPDGEKVDVSFNPDTCDELGIELIARNIYMKSIEGALIAIKGIAGMKEESVEQTIKRLQKDSAK